MKFLTKNGDFAVDLSDEIVKSTLVTLNGEIVHAGAKEAMGL